MEPRATRNGCEISFAPARGANAKFVLQPIAATAVQPEPGWIPSGIFAAPFWFASRGYGPDGVMIDQRLILVPAESSEAKRRA
jgi:hypothetical protein